MCRNQLPVWREFVKGMDHNRAEFLAVAVDAQGPRKAAPYLERAEATFQCAVDSDNLLAEAFDFKAIPNGVFVDEEGFVLYMRLGNFNIQTPEFARLARHWANGLPPQELTDAPPTGRDLSIKRPEALQSFRQGMDLLREGKKEQAVALWRRGMALEPDNFVIRKQIWAVENPDRFYDGEIDTDWQGLQRELGQ